jgi:hypothetical protein
LGVELFLRESRVVRLAPAAEHADRVRSLLERMPTATDESPRAGGDFAVPLYLPATRSRNAALTLAGIELMNRIRQGQFGLGRRGVQGRAAPALWNAVFGACSLHGAVGNVCRCRLFAPEPNG